MAPSPPTPHPAQQPSVQPWFRDERGYLITTAAAGSAALIAWISNAPIHPALLACAGAVAAVTAWGYLVRSAEARLHRRLELTVTRKLDEAALKEAYEEGHAAGYLAGVEAAQSGKTTRLRSVP